MSIYEVQTIPVRALWLDKKDVADVPSMRKALARIEVEIHRLDMVLPSIHAGRDSITPAEYHRAKGRNHQLFSSRYMAGGLALEINRTDSGGSAVTRKAHKMSEQFVNAAEILDKSADLFKNSLSNFTATSDLSIGSAKKRVSQMADYNARLATSLANLNKSLGGEGLFKALEAAERMVTALEKLDELEKTGRLGKILAAIQK